MVEERDGAGDHSDRHIGPTKRSITLICADCVGGSDDPGVRSRGVRVREEHQRVPRATLSLYEPRPSVVLDGADGEPRLSMSSRREPGSILASPLPMVTEHPDRNGVIWTILTSSLGRWSTSRSKPIWSAWKCLARPISRPGRRPLPVCSPSHSSPVYKATGTSLLTIPRSSGLHPTRQTSLRRRARENAGAKAGADALGQ